MAAGNFASPTAKTKRAKINRVTLTFITVAVSFTFSPPLLNQQNPEPFAGNYTGCCTQQAPIDLIFRLPKETL